MITALEAASTSLEVLIPIKRIARSLNVKPVTILRMARRGDFPQPIDLGMRKKQFLFPEVERWWRTRLGGRNGQPFPLAPAQPDDDR